VIIGIFLALIVISIPLLFFFLRWIANQGILSGLFNKHPYPPAISAATTDPTMMQIQPTANSNEVKTYMDGKNWAMAIKTLDRLIEQTPNSSEYYYERAESYHEMYHGLRDESEGIHYFLIWECAIKVFRTFNG
jgi:hypothetical protein